MKKFFLFLLLCFLWHNSAYCQRVSYKDETIYVDEKPYAIMKKHGAIVPHYSIRTLDNKEIMLVKFNKGEDGSQHYTISFIGSGKQTIMKGDLGFGKKLAIEIVENDMMKNGDINPDGEKRFLLLHPGSEQNSPGFTGMPGTIARDRGQNIFIVGKKIIQDNVTIGNYKRSVSTINGDLYNVFSFYLPDGTMIAEATLKQFNSQVCKLVTIKDNIIRSVSVRSDIDFDQVKEIAIYLSLHYYL